MQNTTNNSTTQGTVGATLDTAEVAKHSGSQDCWIIINDNVYDVTQYIPFHPGGQQRIINYCGKDATQAFNTRGGEGKHSSFAWNTLGNYYIGAVGQALNETNTVATTQTGVTSTSQSQTTTTSNSTNAQTNSSVKLDNATVSSHNSSSDCWLIINNKVYNVTQYIPYHPGGQQRIISYCGKDATQAFDTKGGKGSHSSGAKNTLGNYYLGDLNSSTSSSTIENTGSSSSIPSSGGEVEDEDEYEDEEEGQGSSSSSSNSKYEEAILKKYPGADITKLSVEDDGKAEAKFYWNGNKYEAKLNSNYEITSAKIS